MNVEVEQAQVSWQAAQKAVEAAAQKAVALGVKVNAAVVDAGGNLAAFARVNGAPLHSITIAEDKAYTAASFGVMTSEFYDLIKESPALREGIVQRPRLIVFGGGLPIVSRGRVIGGIGVSGASEAQDEECARAGLAAIGF